MIVVILFKLIFFGEGGGGGSRCQGPGKFGDAGVDRITHKQTNIDTYRRNWSKG